VADRAAARLTATAHRNLATASLGTLNMLYLALLGLGLEHALEATKRLEELRSGRNII
jgi:hypothetical protein